jgi:hypothetical protein
VSSPEKGWTLAHPVTPPDKQPRLGTRDDSEQPPRDS